MFSVITNIYNKKAKGPTLMELFEAIGKRRKYNQINFNFQIAVFWVVTFSLLVGTPNVDSVCSTSTDHKTIHRHNHEDQSMGLKHRETLRFQSPGHHQSDLL
jgi:hypothetical protein